MNGAAENGAAAGMIDAHQPLHHFRRGRDLGAGDQAVGGLGQTVIGLLRGIGLRDRGGPQRVRQIAIREAALPRPQHPFRHRLHPGLQTRLVGHRRSLLGS